MKKSNNKVSKSNKIVHPLNKEIQELMARRVDLKNMAEEITYDIANARLKEIEKLKEIARDPLGAGFGAFTKSLHGTERKEDMSRSDINPLWRGEMTVTAGHQLEQVREIMCKELNLDHKDHFINRDSIDGIEDTVKEVIDGVVGWTDDLLTKGEMHYDMLIRKLQSMAHEYDDLEHFDDLIREAMVLKGFCITFDVEYGKLKTELHSDEKQIVLKAQIENLKMSVAKLTPKKKAKKVTAKRVASKKKKGVK